MVINAVILQMWSHSAHTVDAYASGCVWFAFYLITAFVCSNQKNDNILIWNFFAKVTDIVLVITKRTSQLILSKYMAQNNLTI